jgi:two-component system, OmpR family, response regulator VicR
MRKRVLVIASIKGMAPVIKETLDAGAFDLRSQSNLLNLVATVLEQKPALVIFDIARWDQVTQNVLSQLTSLQGSRSTRKIILADTASMDDKVEALESGADDLLLKPVSARELQARIGAILRAHAVDDRGNTKTLGKLELHPETMEISTGADRKKLTPKEFEVLGYLMDNPGRVFSRNQLLEAAWIPWEVEDRRVVDVCIYRLREKIEDDPSQPRRIVTRRGEGYFMPKP